MKRLGPEGEVSEGLIRIGGTGVGEHQGEESGSEKQRPTDGVVGQGLVDSAPDRTGSLVNREGTWTIGRHSRILC